MLVTISALELKLDYRKPLYVQVIIGDDDPRIRHTYPTHLAEGRVTIQEQHQINLPLGIKWISIHVNVRKAKYTLRKSEFQFLGKTRIPVAGRVLLTPDADVVTERSQFVPLKLHDRDDKPAAHVTFLMFVVHPWDLSPPKNIPKPSSHSDKAPSLIVSELGTLLDTLRGIQFQNNQLLESLPLLGLIQEHCSRQAFSHSEMEFAPDRANQGNVIDDLVTQLVSHSEFLRVVALPFIAAERRSGGTRVNFEMILRYVQDMFISLFDTSVVLFSWVDTYSVAAHIYFTSSMDGIIKHAFEVMLSTMERSAHNRYMILRRMYPSLQLDAPTVEHPLEARLISKALGEIAQGKSNVLANTLYSLRYDQAQGAMREVQRKLRTHSNDEKADKRDILRRMLTHIAQESDSLPSSLLVSVHLEAGSRFDAGSYGTIHRAQMLFKDGSGSKAVALKAMPVYPRTGDTVQRLRQMYLEVLTCQSLSCKNVVKILGIFQKKPDVFIVMDYFPRGNTLNYRTKMCGLRSYRDGRLVDLLHKWMSELSVGLRYLHQEGIVHGDIRGVNLLVDNSETLLITDFGLSVFANGHSQQYLSRRTGNAQWMAPEIMERTQGISLRPTKESDTYSFSHTCIELFTGKAPYEQYMKDTRKDIRDEIVFAKRRPPLPTIYDLSQPRDMSRDLYKLLTRCWTDNPEERLTMDTVMRLLQAHDFGAIYSASYS